VANQDPHAKNCRNIITDKRVSTEDGAAFSITAVRLHETPVLGQAGSPAISARIILFSHGKRVSLKLHSLLLKAGLGFPP
jgi:hypothetical protein